MQTELTTSNGILDIIVPDIPESGVLTAVLMLVLLTGVCIASFYLWQMFATAKGRARRRLSKLINKKSDASKSNIITAFEIADTVRDGLGLRCLSANKILPDKVSVQDPLWQSFVQRLDKARYSAGSISRKELAQLMSDARHWLK